jgi:hypothetical protein
MSPCFAHVRGGGSRRWLLVAPCVLASVALTSGCSGPGAVEVTEPPSPTDRVQVMCGDLIDALPETVAEDLDARDVDPSDALAAAWGDPAVVLRCGVPEPDALTRTSACFEVDGVGWLATQDGREVSGDAPVEGTLTFTTIGRAAYVEVEVPAMDDHQPVDALPALAMPIQQTIPVVHPCQ